VASKRWGEVERSVKAANNSDNGGNLHDWRRCCNNKYDISRMTETRKQFFDGEVRAAEASLKGAYVELLEGNDCNGVGEV